MQSHSPRSFTYRGIWRVLDDVSTNDSCAALDTGFALVVALLLSEERTIDALLRR
jgi:hypothetical protein